MSTSSDDSVDLEVINFKQYLPRTDLKSTSWVRFEIDLLMHPDFFDLTGNEFKVFFHFVQIAGKKQTPQLKMNIKHTAHFLRIKIDEVLSTVKKLSDKRWKLLNKHESVRMRNELVTGTLENEPLEKSRVEESRERSAYERVRVFWQTHAPSLPKVIEISQKRKKAIDRFLSKNSEDDLINLFKQIEASDFLTGRDGKWSGCSFDWAMNPTNQIKVLEGNYKNKNSSVAVSTSSLTEDNF